MIKKYIAWVGALACTPLYALYEYKVDTSPAQGLHWAYGFCMAPDKTVKLYVAKQRLKTDEFPRNRMMYHQAFSKKCKMIKGQYMGGDFGARQRKSTFDLLLSRMPKAEADKINNIVYFDTSYQSVSAPNTACNFKQGTCKTKTSASMGNGHGLVFHNPADAKKHTLNIVIKQSKS
jgi:hypothetical protein